MEQVGDTVNEGRRVDILENLDRGGIVGVNQHNQSDPKEFAMNLVAIGKLGHKVVVQEGKNILRILDPWQGVLPLVSTIDSKTRSSLLAEVRKGGRDGGLHDGMKQMGACFSNVDFSEGSHGLHHIHSAPDPTDGSGVLEYLGKPFIDPVDPGNGSETVVGWFSIVIGHYFCLYFLSIFDPTSFHIPYPTFLPYVYPCYDFPFYTFTLTNGRQKHIRLDY